MNKKRSEQARLLDADEPTSQNRELLHLDKKRFVHTLNELDGLDDIAALRKAVLALAEVINDSNGDDLGILSTNADEDSTPIRKDVVISELRQIADARTIGRSKYYLQRMIKGVESVKTGKINDLNLLRWKEYDDIITDSLWLFDRRDNSGVHLASYWGNFVPQIPHQMLLRFTKKGEWVLDTFVGSGTTLIECRRLGRNGIGIELNPDVARGARQLIEKEQNTDQVVTDVVVGDSTDIDYEALLEKHGIRNVQFLIMHPPYHDIIQFSEDERDLSNAASVEDFIQMFSAAVDNATPFLERSRYFALVIGDKYANGEWIPLGFQCMNEVLKRGYRLKSIIVKNFEDTRGKRSQKELWRYRALVGGFYIFKHEYVMLFQKKRELRS